MHASSLLKKIAAGFLCFAIKRILSTRQHGCVLSWGATVSPFWVSYSLEHPRFCRDEGTSSFLLPVMGARESLRTHPKLVSTLVMSVRKTNLH